MAGASLYEYRDMDLLLRLDRESDNDGWLESNYLADAVGLRNGDAKAMASRLSWMRRYGMVDYDPEKRMWRLSPAGVRVTQSHLKAAQKRTIERVPDESLVDVMTHVTARYMLGDPVVAHMLRREFLFGTKPR